MKKTQGISQKALLVILDGYGMREEKKDNAIAHAKTPSLDHLFKHYPYTTIVAGGESVGLPKGVIGNSEVGHMNLGTGRSVRQDLVRINEAIEKDTLKDMDALKGLIEFAKKSRSKKIHLMGLLSDGGVHSHIDHLRALDKVFSVHSDLNILFHAFMDGRDTARNVGKRYLKELSTFSCLKIASMQGRSIGMDRDRRWNKIKSAYDTFIGAGEITNTDPQTYLKSEYDSERYDEFINPVLFGIDKKIEDGDAIFFINFRPDRAIQLSLALNDPGFTEFDLPVKPGHYLCMTPYIPDEVNLPILFNKEKVKGSLGEYLSSLGKKQFKIAETEKYAHITFFFNGGRKEPFNGEEHHLIPSPQDVKTYDEKPEMSAPEVTDVLVSKLKKGDFDFHLVNFANPDMVGHTGNFEAAVKAIECVDFCVGKLLEVCEQNNIALLLTADHGNSEMMAYEDGLPHTSHVGSVVPFSLFHPSLKDEKFETRHSDKSLRDVSPTILHVLGIENPPLFTGKTIFK